MQKQIHLQIITPEKIKIDEYADMVVMRCTDGDMGILPDHADSSCVLDYGVMRIMNEEGEKRIAVYGGIATIQSNILTILTADAELPEEIDIKRANADREQAEQRLQEKTDDMEIANDQVLLRRALVQIDVSSYIQEDDD